MTNQDTDQPMNRDWLRRLAELEDSCGAVSVGGLAHELGMLEVSQDAAVITRTALRKLIELARRRAGLGVEALAKQANLEVADIIQLERGDGSGLAPRVLLQLCATLGLPQAGVLALAGWTSRPGEGVAEAAARFATWSGKVEPLTAEELSALQEFEKVLARADGLK